MVVAGSKGGGQGGARGALEAIKRLTELMRLAPAVSGVELVALRVWCTEMAALRSTGKLPNGQVPALTEVITSAATS